MSQNLKQKYTVELNLEVKTAEAQVKKLATNINNIWADMGKASNKFAVLKDLADYLELIDSKIADLKGTDLNLFNKIFGTDGANINEALKQTIEPILKSPELIADAMKTAQTKLKAIQENPKAKGTAEGLREIGSAINQMYKLIGQDSPIDIEKQLMGGGHVPERLKLLTDQLNAFELKWQDVLATVGSGGGVNGGAKKIINKVQDEINKLDAHRQQYETMLKNIGKYKKAIDNDDLIDLNLDATVDEAKRLMTLFKELDARHQQFRDNGDASSAAYYENMVKRAEAALQLQAMYEKLGENKSPHGLASLAYSEDAGYALDDFGDELDEIRESIANEITSLNNKIQRLTDGDINIGDANAAVDKIKGIGDHAVSATEYIHGMTIALKEMFDVLSQASDTEYKVLIGGQDISIKKGQYKETSKKTTAEAYLANIMQDTDVDAHSHQGIAANIDAPDFELAIKRQYSGLAKMSAIIGPKDIVTLDLAKVKAEDAYEALKRLKDVTVGKGKQSVSVEDFNKILRDINPEYTNVAQRWDPSKFGDLATHIFNVKQSAQQALNPVEKLKNLLVATAGKDIDFSKYEDLLDILNSNNVGSVFNQISRAEGIEEDGRILQVDDISAGSIHDAIADIQKQKDSFIELRETAGVTYKEIIAAAKEYYTIFNKPQGQDFEFFKKYFHPSEIEEIQRKFMDVGDGFRDLSGVTKELAVEFGIDPDDIESFEKTEDAAQMATDTVNRFNEVVSEIRQNGIESSDSANYYEGQIDEIRSQIDALHELEVISDEVMAQVESDYKEMQESYIGYARGRENVYNELSALNNQATLTEDKDELASIVQKRQELLALAEEVGYFDDDVLDTQKAITLEIAKRARIQEDDYDDWARENGALEQKLELLKEIAYEYGNTITQKQRNRLAELDEKEMSDTGLTAKEEDRQAELFDIINTADRAIEDLNSIYKKIILTLSNGKKIEINPDDAGLRALAKFDDEGYGESYNGQEITDVLFVRKQEQAVIEQTNDALREQEQIQQQIGAEAKDSADTSSDLEKATVKLKEFYELTELVQHKDLSMTDIEIGKYTERLNVAEQELKALGEQGVITSEELDKVDAALAKSRVVLTDAEDYNARSQEEYYSGGGYSYTYAAELYEEEQKNEALRAENNDLRRQLAEGHVVDEAQSGSILKEASEYQNLLAVIEKIKVAVDEKTAAFREEADTVDGVVGQEILALNRLKEAIADIEHALDLAFAADRKLNLPEVKTGDATTNENPHFVTDPQGRVVTMYRGIHGTYGGLVSNRYHGGTFSTDNLELAKEYAGALGKVEKVQLSMKNPFEVEGDGALWNQIDYIGESTDKTSKKLYTLKEQLRKIDDELKNVKQSIPDQKELDLINKGLIVETSRDKKIREITEARSHLQSEIDAIFADDSNPYGKKTTNEIVEIAKEKGYDGVIFKNIIDSATGQVKDLSNVMVTFAQDQIHYIETIGATFESAIDSFTKQFKYFTNNVDVESDEIRNTIKEMASLVQQVNMGDIAADEYEKFVNENLIAKDVLQFAGRSKYDADFLQEALGGDNMALSFFMDGLNGYLDTMREELKKVAVAFNMEDVPLGKILSMKDVVSQSQQDEINNDSPSNLLQSISQLLGQILGVLQGFTGIESDNKNSVKVKEPASNVNVGASDAYELLANKLPEGIATESTLASIKGIIEQITSLIKINNDVKPDNSVANVTDIVADNIKDIVYHAGDLSNISNTLKTLPLGNFKPGKMESTFNGFTGLYTTENFEHLSGNEWEGAPISTIDLSQYKMFDARSDELATKAKDFFNDLNSVIYGYLDVFDYDAFDMAKATNTISIEELYTRFGQVFRDVQMDFNEFKDFIENAQAIVKGHEFNEIEIPDLDQAASKFGTGASLQGVSRDVFNSDTFQTQLLKKLGFEGIDLRGTKYNSAYTGGTVVFDIKPESVRSVNEKWTDVARRLYPENDFWYSPEALEREERRRQLAFDTARAYSQQADSAREQAQYESTSEEDVANAREQLQVEQQITAEKKQQASVDSTESEDIADTQREVTEMEQLVAQVRDVEAAVQAKTDAFTQEGTVVTQVISQEIAALQNLINKLAEAKAAIEAKTGAFVAEGAAVNDAVAKETAAIGEPEVADNVTDIQKEAQAHQDNAYAIREETAAQQDLNAEKQKQDGVTKKKTARSKQTPEQKADKTLQLDALTKYRGELRAIMGKGQTSSVDFNYLSEGLRPEQQEIANLYKNTMLQIEEYIDAVKRGEQVEASSIQNSIALLREKVRVYKNQNNLTDTGKAKKSNRYDGSNAMSARKTQYKTIQNRIGENDLFANSSVLTSAINEYEAAWSKLQGLYTQLQNMPNPTKDDEANFKAASAECNKLGKEVEKLLNTYDKMNSDPTKVGSKVLIDYNNRAKELQDYVDETHGSNAQIDGFKNNYNELLFTIDNGNGTFTKAKVAVDNLGTSIIETHGDVKTATTGFSRLFGELSSKFKSLWVYAASRFGVDEIIQQIRNGIQYVREIDTALTELKKVTNETGATYDAFLQKMSKTAGVVGSTVKDLTTMAAEWARLNI